MDFLRSVIHSNGLLAVFFWLSWGHLYYSTVHFQGVFLLQNLAKHEWVSEFVDFKVLSTTHGHIRMNLIFKFGKRVIKKELSWKNRVKNQLLWRVWLIRSRQRNRNWRQQQTWLQTWKQQCVLKMNSRSGIYSLDKLLFCVTLMVNWALKTTYLLILTVDRALNFKYTFISCFPNKDADKLEVSLCFSSPPQSPNDRSDLRRGTTNAKQR